MKAEEEITRAWMNKKIAFKIIMFSVILVGICFFLGRLFLPSFSQESNFYGKRCFNEQPRNSVETILLGSSVVYHGVSPMEMYEAQGISVWDLGSSWQPPSSSYYLLEEAYRLNPTSLRIVLFDPFELTRETNESLRRMITDAMKYYDIKYQANMDYTDSIKEAISYSIPLISYHSRWTEISKSDFDKKKELRSYLRGYYLDTNRNDLAEYSFSELEVPGYYPDSSEKSEQFEIEALFYFKRMVDFCAKNDLKLVIIKTPMSKHWSSSDHNAMEEIARKYDLDFLDFNYLPLFDEIGFNYATDMADSDHMNYYGARKLTAWLGQYLVEECNATDIRGKVEYERMDEELDEYKRKVEDLILLRSESDPAKYLSRAIGHEDYTIFIFVDKDAASFLTQEQRVAFSDLGLPALSVLGQFDSYLAVIDNAKGVIYEDTEADPGEEYEEGSGSNIEIMERTNEKDIQKSRLDNNKEANEDELIKYENNLLDGGFYVIKSGGMNLGDDSSCVIEDVEWAQGSNGLNFVLYDNTLKDVVDSAVFDTSKCSVRLGDDLEEELNKALAQNVEYDTMPEIFQKLILYNARCEEAKALMKDEESSGEDN